MSYVVSDCFAVWWTPEVYMHSKRNILMGEKNALTLAKYKTPLLLLKPWGVGHWGLAEDTGQHRGVCALFLR